eukprot:TRINITY_DN51107_c0_g1_i1.p1 TRINITY_DN51107_c0_g1~~TRINITY_DN51107_c0_g1_i1.p1  ORF type:complete len:147 (-),score=30.03 TRINITY_DN51107_c0_g1_i1:76-516(-)
MATDEYNRVTDWHPMPASKYRVDADEEASLKAAGTDKGPLDKLDSWTFTKITTVSEASKTEGLYVAQCCGYATKVHLETFQWNRVTDYNGMSTGTDYERGGGCIKVELRGKEIWATGRACVFDDGDMSEELFEKEELIINKFMHMD